MRIGYNRRADPDIPGTCESYNTLHKETMYQHTDDCATHDLAVITLDKPVSEALIKNGRVKIAALPTKDTEVANPITIAGYGLGIPLTVSVV